MKKSLLLSAAIFLFPLFSQAQWFFSSSPPIDPNRRWQIIETDHFEIIYDEKNLKLAQEFASEAERAEKLLQPFFKIPLSKKIPVAVTDVSDAANGSATGVPRSQIEVYPVLPSVTDPTGEYYSWVRELITHEYTHVLNFEPTSGVMGGLRFFLGSIIKPDGFLPRWYLEGLAVEMESRLTPVGRGRSHYYSAFVRSQVEDKTWGKETIDRLNATVIPTWPRGQRPYTYGYFLMHELSEIPNKTNSQESIYGIMNHRYGGRFPWFLNGPMEEYFGENYAELLTDTYYRVENRAQKQMKILQSSGAKNGTAMNQSGYFNFGAQVSPDKLKMAAIVSDFDDVPGIRIWERKSPNEPFASQKEIPEPLVNAKDIHQVSWRSDSRHLVYDHSDIWRHYNTYNDLYDLDIVSKDEKQLTKGMRAREGTVMPDGSLVFVTATSINTQLMQSNADGANATLLYSPPDGERVSTPRPYKDGVIFSHRDSHGKEWIESLSLKSKQIQRLTKVEKTGQMHILPVADPQKPGGFYFAGSDNGVMNIYHGDGKSYSALTNVTTYATAPEPDPTGHQLLYSRLTSEGFRLETAPLEPKNIYLKNIPDLQNYPVADANAAPSVKGSEPSTYNGLKYLWPQYLFPFINFVPGGVIADISTSGDDPLGHHQYAVDLGYDTRAKNPTEAFVYTNASLPFFIDFGVSNDYYYLIGAGAVEHLTYLSLDTRHYLLPNSNKWTLGPEIIYRMTDYPGILFTEVGPGLALNYNNVTPRRDFQISSESGEAFTLAYDYYLPSWGNTSYQNIRGVGTIYFAGKPLPRHNVINVRAAAWVSPPQQTIFTGTEQAGGEYAASLLPTTFLVRGYPIGEFIGSTLLNAGLEYRFPIYYPFSGSGTVPVFANRWHAAVVCDAITLRGGYYDNTTSSAGTLLATDLGTYYVGTGAEARVDLQLFYAIPLTVKFGVYYGFTQKAFGGPSYIIGFGASP